MEKCPSKAVSGPPHSGETHTHAALPPAPLPSPFPHSPAPASHCPSPCPLARCRRGSGLQVGGWPTFVLQAAVGLIALVRAVMEAITDEAQVEAEALVAQVLVPGTALCSISRDGQAGSGTLLGNFPSTRCYGRPPGATPCLPAARSPRSAWVGVLTLTGGHGAVAGAETQGTHTAVRDEGDTQVVGVGVEGRRGHIATKPGGTTRGETAHPRRCCPLPTTPPYSPGTRSPTWLGPPEPG